MEEKCKDVHCPVHGSLSLRGRSFVATVVHARMQRSATVEWETNRLIPKYERYARIRTKIKVHNPDCIGAKKGDIVHIRECKPLSKTKHFVIVKKVGEDILFTEKEALLEESRVKTKKKSEDAKTEKVFEVEEEAENESA